MEMTGKTGMIGRTGMTGRMDRVEGLAKNITTEVKATVEANDTDTRKRKATRKVADTEHTRNSTY